MVRESTSASATPPAVTSALRKPIVPAMGMSNCLAVRARSCRSVRLSSAARRSGVRPACSAIASASRCGSRWARIPTARRFPAVWHSSCKTRSSDSWFTSGRKSQRSSKELGPRVAADGPAHVEHRRAGDAEMGEQDRAALPGQARRPPRIIRRLQHAHARVRNRNSLEGQNRGGVRGDGHQRRVRRDDRVAQGGRPAVSVAAGAASRIGPAAGGQDDRLGQEGLLRGDDLEAGGVATDFGHRFVQGNGASSASQAGEQRGQDVAGAIAAGKDLAALLDLGCHAFRLEQLDDGFGREGGQGRMEESALVGEGRHDAAGVGGVGEIAARAAGKEELRSGASLFLQQAASSGRARPHGRRPSAPPVPRPRLQRPKMT